MSRMWPDVVVVEPPALEQLSGVGEVLEYLLVQELVAQSADEAIVEDCLVVGGNAHIRIREARRPAISLLRGDKRTGTELSAAHLSPMAIADVSAPVPIKPSFIRFL